VGTVVNRVIGFHRGNLLSSRVTVSFWRTLFHGGG
jgi:hypothetical protein